MDLFHKVGYCIILVLLVIMLFLLLYMIYINFKLWLLETYNEDNNNIFYRFLLKIFNAN
jgi:hypothetical protein